MIPYFFGKIENGKLKLADKESFISYIQKFNEKDIKLNIQLDKKDRSNSQNAYMWGVLIRMIADEMGMTDDATHEMLKMMFLKVGYEHKGKRYEYARSTTSLSTIEFEDYCERIRLFASSELGLIIPLPGEVLINL